MGCDKFDQAAHLRDATQELSWGRVYCLSFCIRSIPTRCLFACLCMTMSRHFTLDTLDFTFHTLHISLYTLQSALYIPHFTHCTLHPALYTLHFTLHTLHTTLGTLHLKFYTWLDTAHSNYSLHSTLYTLHFTLHTLHFILFP